MRFFVALEVPEKSKLEIEAVQQQIIRLIPEAKLTSPEKLHLTIAFIGEEPPELKNPLIEIIKSSVENIPPFTVIPAYIDGFPHLHTANTLWIGVKEDIDKLYELRHHIKDGLEKLQLSIDQRRFVPHIAIAKLNNFQLSPNLETELEKIMSTPFTPIMVSAIKLFESIPDEGLHSHNTLAEIPLDSSV